MVDIKNIKIVWSNTTGFVPTSLSNGQIAINQKDKKLFYPDENGVIQEFSLVAGGGSGLTFPQIYSISTLNL